MLDPIGKTVTARQHAFKWTTAHALRLPIINSPLLCLALLYSPTVVLHSHPSAAAASGENIKGTASASPNSAHLDHNMEPAFIKPPAQSTLQRRLSKMYSDTKRSYDTVTEPPKTDITPELTSLHRKFRIQKDRLITWGLEWSDTTAAQPGDIDESLEREGFTEVVGSVMSSIKEILDEADQLRYSDKSESRPRKRISSGAKPEERSVSDQWSVSDKPRFEDLLHDLTDCIDTLYGLSKWRSNQRRSRSSGPMEGSLSCESGYFGQGSYAAKISEKGSSVPTPAATISPGPRSSLQINRESLVLVHGIESSSQPPPYETVAIPSNSRTMGYLQRQNTSNNPWKRDGNRMLTIPVFIEYAPFDPIYSSTGIYPPMTRLEQLADGLHQPEGTPADPDFRVLNMAGYFEDPENHRFGLVYNLPERVWSSSADQGRTLDGMAPFTLLSVLQASAKPENSFLPNLEDRFRLAYNLATTLLKLHTRKIQHRDVTSNNVVFFQMAKPALGSAQMNQGRELRQPYLCSFDVFSESDFEVRSGKHIYRHPLDSSEDGNSKREYRASFDVYSLGLILLEIGLWMPLNSFMKPRYDLATFKSRIETIYAKKLGQKCGSIYMRVVESCLSAADREIADSRNGKPFNIQWILYCDVVRRLEQCCAIDDFQTTEQTPLPTPQQTSMNTSSVASVSSKESVFPPAKVNLPLRRTLTKSHHHINMEDSGLGSIGDSDKATEDNQSISLEQAAVVQTWSSRKTTKLDVSSKPRLRVHPVKITSSQLDEWHEVLLPKLERLVGKALKDSPETYTIDLISIGETVQTARPTILVTCTSVGRVKHVLSRRFPYEKDVYDLKVRAGKLRRSAARAAPKRMRSRTKRSASNLAGDDPPPMNPFHQERPLCGASIGAWKDETHLPAVTYGGVILVDGEHYGMTVHHLLDNPSEDEGGEEEEENNPTRSSSRRSGSYHLDMYSQPTPQSSYEMPYDAYITDSSGDELGSIGDSEDDFDSSDEMDYSDDDDSVISDTGDIMGVVKGQGDHLIVTQPAIDDVEEDFFPNLDDMDEDHLNSHTLGKVFASSGIRRWRRERVTHEIDWALLKVDEHRLQPHNVVQGGRRYCRNGNTECVTGLLDPVCRHPKYRAEEDLYPNEVAKLHDLGDLKVHCMGRTTGLKSGVISPAMSSMRVSGRRTPSRSWHVIGGLGSMFSHQT